MCSRNNLFKSGDEHNRTTSDDDDSPDKRLRVNHGNLFVFNV